MKQVAELYFVRGDDNNGLLYAHRAYDAAPANSKASFDVFLSEIKGRPGN
jgi:hypothetical protein